MGISYVFWNILKTWFIHYLKILRQRKLRKLELEISNVLPDFSSLDFPGESAGWTISPLPQRLQVIIELLLNYAFNYYHQYDYYQNRQLDLGDVAPHDSNLLKNALQANVQGIQVDFDDGNCPSWANQIKGNKDIIVKL